MNIKSQNENRTLYLGVFIGIYLALIKGGGVL